MSDEITVSTSLLCKNGNYNFDRRINSVSADQSAIGANGGVQDIGTGSHEAVAVGDVSTPGWAIFRNLDDTNFVEIGIDVGATFYPIAKILPGEPAAFRLSSSTLYAKADTATVKLEFTILES